MSLPRLIEQNTTYEKRNTLGLLWIEDSGPIMESKFKVPWQKYVLTLSMEKFV